MKTSTRIVLPFFHALMEAYAGQRIFLVGKLSFKRIA